MQNELLDKQETMISSAVHTTHIEQPIQKPAYEFFKRLFDFISSLLVSLIIFIPCAIVALLIVIVDPGNPFYFHKRVGKNGKDISILKFRSMKKSVGALEDILTPEQLQQYQEEYKIDNDPRIIPGIGSFIRKSSIDELPQIVYNILLKGDLSVVGPRPIVRDELESKYTKEEQQILLTAKPGLTGYWQAYARNDARYETGMRQKMELKYCRDRSFKLDIKIILRTVITVLKKSGAQ